MAFDEPNSPYLDPQHGMMQGDGSRWPGTTPSEPPIEVDPYGPPGLAPPTPLNQLGNPLGEQRLVRRVAPGGGSPLLAGVIVGLFGFAVAGGVLWFKQGQALAETRAVLGIVIPDVWFSPGNADGVWRLRVFVVAFTLIAFLVLTLLRYRLATARARSEDEPGRPVAILCLTVVRTLLIAEAVALFFLAGRLNDPTESGWPLFGASVGMPVSDWTWFANTMLPWIVLALIVIGTTINSATRAIRRAETIAASRL
ncbi:hypothetical protein [Actinokineospora diospyrosa]|uniref:DUF2975 family protein n=1 Tax=Actinokineospora diospyrosa TaxID=103728 RepID=A0ABT1IDW7_9PSEU|nr:hypothetical protein [Actinokineospora diospyrosa]MCP2270832.1 hypothetical protein [Actinokineospora diospyrosa]